MRIFKRRNAVQPRVHSTPMPLNARAAKLAAVLTDGLQTEVVVQHVDDDLVFMINDRAGRYLSNNRGLEGGEARPIFVAFVPVDPARPIDAHFETVADSTVGYAGVGGASTAEQVGEQLVRHYLPAVDPEVPAWTWDTPWNEELSVRKQAGGE
jgi:hypothetical protein